MRNTWCAVSMRPVNVGVVSRPLNVKVVPRLVDLTAVPRTTWLAPEETEKKSFGPLSITRYQFPIERSNWEKRLTRFINAPE